MRALWYVLLLATIFAVPMSMMWALAVYINRLYERSQRRQRADEN